MKGLFYFIHASLYVLVFVFSLKETNPDWRWQLQPSGRFAHNKKYVEEVALECSLKVLHYEEMLGFRKEGVNDVNGHIFVMQKVQSASGDDEL